MKKWAVGTMALIGCGWASAMWMHTELAEDGYNVSLEAFGERHGLSLTEVGYEKSLLGSRARTEVEFNQVGSLGTADPFSTWFDSNRLVLVHDIEHGPLILSDGVQPLAARVVTTLDLESLSSDSASWVREACGCEAPLRIVSLIGHGGSATHQFDSNSLRWQTAFNGVNASMRTGAISGELTVNGSDVSSRGEIGEVSLLTDVGAFHHKPTTWSYSGIVSDLAGIGLFEVASPGASLRFGGDSYNVRGMQLRTRNSLVDDTVLSEAKLGFDSATGPVTVGPSELNVTVRGMPQTALSHYLRTVSQADNESVDGIETLLNAVLNLVQPGVGVDYAVDLSTLSGHRARLGLSLEYSDGDDPMITVGDALKRVGAELTVRVEGGLAQEWGIEPLLIPLSQYAVSDGDSLALNAKLADGQAKLNDQVMPVLQMIGPASDQPLPTVREVAEQIFAGQQVSQATPTR